MSEQLSLQPQLPLQQPSQSTSSSQPYPPYSPPQDPMEVTIGETLDRLNRLRTDVSEMGNKITYLRDIRPRALALLAQADEAEAEANRLDSEKSSVEKEVERLKTVVARMEDMRFSTKQLTDQMLEDTASQMRHILENGKSIVPRHPSARMTIKRSTSDEAESGPLFKIPRRESNNSGDISLTMGSRPSSSATSTGSVGSPVTTKFSPNRSQSLTPGSLTPGYTNYTTSSETPRSLTSAFMEMAQLPDGSPMNASNLHQPMIVPSSIPNGSISPYPTPPASYPMATTQVGSYGSMGLYPPTGSSLASALAFAPESSYMEDPPSRDVLYR